MTSSARPICVDLDGTLVRTDLLVESFFALLRRKPWALVFVLLWLARGKAYCKDRIAREVDMDVALLPYHEGLLACLRELRASGRTLILATASHRKYADKVAAHLRIFDEVLATEDGCNLSGLAKQAALVERFGRRGFDYAGNARPDLAVWSAAAEAVLVNPEIGVKAKLERIGIPTRVLDDRNSTALSLARSLRLHQWLKNLLLLVPLVAAHETGDLRLLLQAALAFLAFGFTASSVYVLNDLLDLEADRRHPRKRGRPFASGQLPIGYGIALIPILLILAAAISFAFLPDHFLLALVGYYVLTIAYSLWAKTRVMVDVLFLAGLYTVRILAGAAAVSVMLSFWLLAFSMFLFLSLALVKRYSELVVMIKERVEKVAGRGYKVEDLPLLQSLGAASGYLSVLVLALYINSPDVHPLYARPIALWALCPLLLFWISRVWMKTHRGEMHDDPVVFAARDRVSLTVGLMGAVALLIATI
jgi:4-hydroxybenzoate polyprenyltransferase/phosphoserine phosphatase